MTKEWIASEAKEAKAQNRADRKWEPLIRGWKSWLAGEVKHRDAESALAAVTDPRAVASIWRVFATGRARDQQQAVQLLGQIQCAAASRALALLTVSGKSSEVRRVSMEILRWRDPVDFADVLIGLLRDPVKYEVHPVGGPGQPGALTVKGNAFNLEHIYAPPPPPNIPIVPGDNVTFDGWALPVISRYTDTAELPFAWVWRGYVYPSGCVIPPHVPVKIQLGGMWLENWKSARSAHQQMGGDVAAIERVNDLQRAANEQVVEVLYQTTGRRLPADRDAWYAWWFKRLGRTYLRASDPIRPTLTQFVPLSYLPRDAGGLGFDPAAGYYLLVPVRW